MFYLTKDEVRAIYIWLKQNRYNNFTDTLKIIFEPWLNDVYVSVSLTKNGKTEWLEFNEDGKRFPSVTQIFLGRYTLDLSFDENIYGVFLPVLNKYMAYQAETDTEPAASFVFTVKNDLCEIYVVGTSIGTHRLKTT
jgi:hypothetical protein